MKISDNKLVSMTYSIYEGDDLLENVDTPVSFIYGKETNCYKMIIYLGQKLIFTSCLLKGL